MEKTDLEESKKEFEILQKKYSLPKFEELAEEFDIERLEEKPKTNFVLRDIRRIFNEKVSAYLHLFETLMNPSSAPMMVFLMLKNSTETDKKNIEDVYRKLAKFEISSIKLDTIYSEKKEAEFISSTYAQWQDLKKSMFSLIEKFDSNFDINAKDNRKGYFG